MLPHAMDYHPYTSYHSSRRCSCSPAPSSASGCCAQARGRAVHRGSTPTGSTACEADEIEEERLQTPWELLVHQFRDPLIYILLAAAAVTLVLRDYIDTGVILAVLLLNALIGYLQESRAQREMAALARLAAPRAEVLRDGAPRSVPSRELVAGDVVLLASGARVPSDLRLLAVRALEIDESALTGESLPARKTTEPLDAEFLVPGDQTNLAFAGTVVTRGRGRGVVVRTGRATEIGRITQAVRAQAAVATPLQERIERFGRKVGLVVVGLALLVGAIGLARALPADEIFLAAVALAVSAIPEGLPVVLTVTLAIGVRRMAKRRAIVRTLPAVETLGSTTVIGSDKTGTLTQNQMTVVALRAGGRDYETTGTGYGTKGEIRRDGRVVTFDDEPALALLLACGTLANEAPPPGGDEEPVGDPTEIALHVAAAKGGLDPRRLRGELTQLDLLPFEPEHMAMASLEALPEGGTRLHAKGAPEKLLALCSRQLGADGRPEPLDRETAHATADRMANAGLRVLAMAFRDGTDERFDNAGLGDELIFVGLAGMEDPVRPEAIAAVAATRRAGIRTLMLTGDHARTARAIGARLGLQGEEDPVLEGSDLETLSDEALDRELSRVSVFARVAPEHKLRIVERLKAGGETVAVTGDGVNDAPALRAAHLGIAMGASGTDVAREASDIVLADDNFATIVAAVEEGRVVFSNVRKVTFFLLSTAVGEVLAILAALAVGWPLPFVAAQILWINLVTNGLQDVALAFEPGEPGLLERPPRPAGEDLVTLRLLERLGAVGLLLGAGTLASFWWVLERDGDLAYARTVAMTQMVVFQFFHVFNSRSLDRSLLRIPAFSNRFLFASLVAAAAAHLAVLHLPLLQRIFRTAPLAAGDWTLVFAIGLTAILGGELDKWRNRRTGRLLG
jgi:magnesium-transporting ATPase (P-type)